MIRKKQKTEETNFCFITLLRDRQLGFNTGRFNKKQVIGILKNLSSSPVYRVEEGQKVSLSSYERRRFIQDYYSNTKYILINDKIKLYSASMEAYIDHENIIHVSLGIETDLSRGEYCIINSSGQCNCSSHLEGELQARLSVITKLQKQQENLDVSNEKLGHFLNDLSKRDNYDLPDFVGFDGETFEELQQFEVNEVNEANEANEVTNLNEICDMGLESLFDSIFEILICPLFQLFVKLLLCLLKAKEKKK